LANLQIRNQEEDRLDHHHHHHKHPHWRPDYCR